MKTLYKIQEKACGKYQTIFETNKKSTMEKIKSVLNSNKIRILKEEVK